MVGAITAAVSTYAVSVQIAIRTNTQPNTKLCRSGEYPKLMNCGRRAAKNIAVFRFSNATRKPFKNNRLKETRIVIADGLTGDSTNSARMPINILANRNAKNDRESNILEIINLFFAWRAFQNQSCPSHQNECIGEYFSCRLRGTLGRHRRGPQTQAATLCEIALIPSRIAPARRRDPTRRKPQCQS